MKLYNSQINKIVTVSDHIGAKMLRYNHIEKGGIYCKESDMSEYFEMEKVTEVSSRHDESTQKVSAKPDYSEMTKAELIIAAVEKLGVTESQAKALKKDELIAALQS